MGSVSKPLRETIAIDLGLVVALAILWARPLGGDQGEDIPTALLALSVYALLSFPAFAVLMGESPFVRPRRRAGPKPKRKSAEYRAGIVTGFVALAIVEVLTGFQGPAFFNVTAALGVVYTVWLATDAFGRYEAVGVQATSPADLGAGSNSR